MAYQPFVETHQISTVRNCFLIPTASSDVIDYNDKKATKPM
ncbi:hypothetical protein L0P50_00720 [Lawsonibacter sp. DFI.6.74]|nr:hypothetical protein [Lawsonibacter sp. DFI.6.74]MCG4771641.1 hypothetical protein [Lawsonibacter sp. DFI.5.51]